VKHRNDNDSIGVEIVEESIRKPAEKNAPEVAMRYVKSERMLKDKSDCLIN
jgi:hypothetical protein